MATLSDSLGDRVLGRIVAQDVLKPGSEEIAVPAGTMMDEQWVVRMEEMGIDEVIVRSPITCEVRTVSVLPVTVVIWLVDTG